MDSSNFKFIEAKTILSKLKQTDSWFGITYNMNLYRGCQHGCIYSDTRSECYGIGNISTISIKRNALELLSHELSSKRKNKGTIGTGSMNDPYMPIENRLRLTRQALQLIEKEKFPIHIITKSNLVTRDIDLLQEISKTYAAVSFTITTTDDWLAGKIEPNAPTSSSRFEALKQIADKGIYTGITLIPILPFINDTPKNVLSLLRKAADAGASYVLPMFGVTLRKGSREYFYQALDTIYPGMKTKYIARFENLYVCNSPDNLRLWDLFQNEAVKLQLNTCMKFHEPLINKQLMRISS